MNIYAYVSYIAYIVDSRRISQFKKGGFRAPKGLRWP